ncbi:hypothetical protein [Moorena sp. SIO4G3]|uniref:hypothetical protein n=1 Tax=Moorena sp. SIO4G3 TaxID=2607821 RepID=UPI00142CF6B1|nr:hypothetical protein [Moorena sp. SIO4G3]NEO78273.1 hypothetical protein [Moorena sp. SIO4G3]
MLNLTRSRSPLAWPTAKGRALPESLISQIAGIFDNYRALINLTRLTCSHATRTLISQIAGNSDSKRFSSKLLNKVLLLLAQIAGIFDNYRALINLTRLTCSHATRTLISQIAGNSDSKRFSRLCCFC